MIAQASDGRRKAEQANPILMDSKRPKFVFGNARVAWHLSCKRSVLGEAVAFLCEASASKMTLNE